MSLYELAISGKGHVDDYASTVKNVVLNTGHELKVIRPDLCDINGVSFGKDCVVRAAFIHNVTLGDRVKIFGPGVNIYGNDKTPTVIENDSRVGSNVEIQNGVLIGQRSKIQSHSFLCEGVTIEDEVFVAHGVMFTNDKWPACMNAKGEFKGPNDWKCEPTYVRRGAVIGSGATIVPGVTIGEYAFVGAGAVVTKDVKPYTVVAGNPAKKIRVLTIQNIKEIQQGLEPLLEE